MWQAERVATEWVSAQDVLRGAVGPSSPGDSAGAGSVTTRPKRFSRVNAPDHFAHVCLEPGGRR